VRNTHCVQKTWIKDFNGTVPYVTASAENNSVDSYVEYDPLMIDKGNAIVIGGKTFVVTYQKSDFFSNDSHNLTLRLKGIEGNERIYLFLAAVIARGLGSKYSWGDSVSFKKIQGDRVTLPVCEDGAIDFAYMEAYIRELEAARLRELEKYLIAAGFTDCKLTQAEKFAVDNWENGKALRKTFKAADLFFVKSNPQLNKESFVFAEGAEYPYFTRTVFNNGILGYVNYLDDEHKIYGGSLAVGMLGMQFFYMQHDFYAGQFTKTVFPKFEGFDEPVALFFASLFNKGRDQFLKGLVRDFQRLFLDYEVSVPVGNDGSIDLSFIRSFVRGIMKLSIRNVIDRKDKEIAATKKVIGGAK